MKPLSRICLSLTVLLLGACASTPDSGPSAQVMPLAAKDIDVKGCGLTLTQPKGGTLFVVSQSGDARIRLGKELLKLKRKSADGDTLPGGQRERQTFVDATGMVSVHLTLTPTGIVDDKARTVAAKVEVDTPSGFNLLDMAGLTGC